MRTTFIALILVASLSAHATTSTKVTIPLKGVDHDLPVNDPSIKPLRLKKLIPQQSYAILGALNEMKEAVADGAEDILDLAMLPMNPFPAMQKYALEKIDEQMHDYTKLRTERPDWFKVLELHKDRYVPQLENGPSLVNADHEFAGISDRRFGYCWGFATLVRFFHTVAFYDRDGIHSVPDPVRNRSAWLKAQYKAIDQITEGRATVLYGFSNFREFSMVPELELYLKLKAMQLWQERIITLKTLPVFYGSTKAMTKDGTALLKKKLKAKIARGELPKILFTALYSKKFLGGSTDIHASLVYGIEDHTDGSWSMKLWDINFYAESLMASPKTIDVHADGEVHFLPWYEEKNPDVKPELTTLLGTVSLAPEEASETAMMVNSLHAFCEKNSGRCL